MGDSALMIEMSDGASTPMLDNKVTKAGTLLFHDGIASIEGWELKEPGMCREHAIFACLHVAEILQKAAMEMINAPGGAPNVVSDLPTEVAAALGLWPRVFDGIDDLETSSHG